MSLQSQKNGEKTAFQASRKAFLPSAFLLATLLVLALCSCTTTNTTSTDDGPAFRNVDLGCGWQPIGSLELEHAQGYTVDHYEDGFELICIADGTRYLVVPEGKEAPDGLHADIALIQQPVQNVYLVASDTMCLIDALGMNDRISLCGTKPNDCAVDGFRAALESGAIRFGGKYNSPDYELILQEGCPLAIESTMINHAPEVREKLRNLGLTVLTEQSSYEASAMGRMEWIKLYGTLFDAEDHAKEIYDAQIALIDQAAADGPTGKTVAFFYINSNGAAVVRQSGDYVPQMIDMAGGDYIFNDLSDGSAKSTITLEMEQFYTTAKNADVIIYNTSIGQSFNNLDEFIGQNPLLAEFSAVQNGEVWLTNQDIYQQMILTGDIIDEMYAIFSGTGDSTSFDHFKRLENA